MSNRYFGTDGIRGEYGVEPFTDNFFIVAGVAIGKYLSLSKKSNKKIIIGSDTRESCKDIINFLSQGLFSEGCEISNAGIVPTPAIAYYTKKKNFSLGIMVSASHNLYQDNGVKIFNNKGHKLSEENERNIENYIEKAIIQNKKFIKKKIKIKNISNQIKLDYIKFCLDTINKKKFIKKKLTLDVANGANYEIAKKIFIEGGFSITVRNNIPNGKNINDKCGSTFLKAIKQQIIDDNSDYGISMDGDGDRLIVVTKKGKILDGDDILYTIIKGKKINNEKIKGVVGTVMTNCALENYLKRENINFIRAQVGDKFVLEKMLENNYDLGGEASGHIIILKNSSSGDSIIAALQFLYYSSILKKNNKSSLLRKYPNKIINFFINKLKSVNAVNSVIKKALNKYSSDNIRLIIRKSGTENCLRVMIESKSKDLVDKTSQSLMLYIKKNLK